MFFSTEKTRERYGAMGRQMGHLKCILLTERRQSGKLAYLRVPTTYDIWEKANHGKGEKIIAAPGVCGGVEG